MPQATRDQLRQRFLDRYSGLVPPAPRGQSDESRRPRRPYVRADERAIGYVPYAKGELPDPLPATLVAFYLPQFHTIPENDEWWGKGFTEWRNVTRALPQFEGHYQPKLPGDLGFYDLRNPEVMREQARLAREYGIAAFCFYFYWFDGKTLLETPLRNWLNDKSIDLPFCLCWANEKWTRTWDGRGHEILIDQQHSPEDDLAFIEYVAEYMRDPRYFQVDGKPVLLVYRPGLLPNANQTSSRWRDWCRSAGLGEIHLIYVQSFETPPPLSIGFDAAAQFPPNLFEALPVTQTLRLINPDYRGRVLDWMTLSHTKDAGVDYSRLYAGINVSWDNEARRPGNGRIFIRSSPYAYGQQLTKLLQDARNNDGQRPIVFVNAWNEWAEGATLEPDLRHGYGYLSATRNCLSKFGPKAEEELNACVIVHAWYLDALEEILDQLEKCNLGARVIFTTTHQLSKAVNSMAQRRRFSYEISIHPNKGRDILPFLKVASQLGNEGVRWVLKLHTKKSFHLNNGDSWRSEMVRNLLPQGRIDVLCRKLRENETAGLIGPDGHLLDLAQYMGANQGTVTWLLSQIGALPSCNGSAAAFPSGSMFWARLNALGPLLSSGLVPSDFEDEAEQLDGTLAHGVERLFGMSASQAGYSVIPMAELLGNDPVMPNPRIYPYAAPSKQPKHDS